MVVLGALAAGAVFAYVNRGDIRDAFLASTFEASPRIDEISAAIDPTPLGKRIFFASEPTIGGREEFSNWCAGVDHSEEGHVLGCFAHRKIHLFEVSEPRLEGIVEVTAAHELLHAAFSRLRPAERFELSKDLRRDYERLVEGDTDLEERMGVYEQLSDSAFANELHSVLGTEVSDLSPKLQAHYAKYFVNRDEILELYESYHSVFTELTERATALGSELDALRADIEARTAAYDEAVRQFNEAAADFKARNERYEFSGKKELFDSIRDGLLAQQAQLEITLDGLRADTDRFNALRQELIDLNDVSSQLNEVLDSQLTAPTTRPDSDM